MSVRVKICGITRLEDALAAVEAGADYLGFNFYTASPRAVSVTACRTITHTLAEKKMAVATVGVFVNHGLEDIRSILEACDLGYAQLSGDEPPELLAAIRDRAFKAIRAKSVQDALAQGDRYANTAIRPALLLDGHQPGRYGGTGRAADLEAARILARRAPLMLAGGLTPDNVASAIASVRPWAVDAASGVESAPGIKDSEKIARLIANAKAT